MWLAGPRRIRAIGAVYGSDRSFDFFSLDRLPRLYDALIYFEETSPSRLLPFVR